MNTYRIVFESLREAVLLLDAEGNVEEMNPAGVAFFDAAELPDAVPQSGRKGSLPPEFREELLALTAAEVSTGPLRKSFRTCDAVRHMDIEVKPRPSAGGAIVVFRDTTDLQTAEDAIRYRSEFARLVSEISARFVGAGPEEFEQVIKESLEKIGAFTRSDSAYVFQFSERGDRVTMTHAWTSENVATSPDELVDLDVNAMPWWMERLKRAEVVAVSSVSDLPGEAQVEKSILASQGIASLLDVPLIYKGEPIGFMGLSSAVEGRVWGADDVYLLSIVGQVFTNAVQHKRSEEVLAKERNLLRTLIDNLPDYIYAKDAESRFILNNKAHLRLLRATAPEQVYGKRDYDIFPKELADQYYRDEQEIVRTGTPLVNREESVITEAGERRWLLTTKVPLRDGEGNPIGIMGMSRDITNLKLMAESLESHAKLLEQANAGLQMRNQELDEFTYIASHDLQEPLRKLTSFTDALREDMRAQDAMEVQRDLDVIASAAQRMQRLVRDLLVLSRSGRQSMEWEPVDLNECVAMALDALEIRIGEVEAEIQKETLPVVQGDRTLLTQLYQNLIGNALKFHGDSTPRVLLSVRSTPEGWVLGVRDHGIGIKMEYAEQIFAPFKRLHGRRSYEGTGIGLAICRKIVERHGGTIWVDSRPGKGAHFQFSLPAREGEAVS